MHHELTLSHLRLLAASGQLFHRAGAGRRLGCCTWSLRPLGWSTRRVRVSVRAISAVALGLLVCLRRPASESCCLSPAAGQCGGRAPAPGPVPCD
jgi:hypothetical protein